MDHSAMKNTTMVSWDSFLPFVQAGCSKYMDNSNTTGTVYIRVFKKISDQVNSTWTSKMFCVRGLGSLIITF